MKILFLSDDFPPLSFGGAGISTSELAAGMKRVGHQVFAITTCRRASDAGEADYQGIKVFKIPSDYPGRWRAYRSLYNRPVVQQVEEILKKIKPDIVHANNIHFYLSYHSIKVAKRIARVVVWTGRDVMAFNFAKLQTKRYLENLDCRTTWRDHLRQAKKRWNPFRNFFIRKYLGYADKLFAVSNALKKALTQNGINNVEVMHTGIDIDTWRQAEPATNLFREKYNIKNKKVILFGGRLSPAKGGRHMVEAVAEIALEVPDVILLVAAKTDEYAEMMKKYAEDLGVGDRLIFTGWIEREEIGYAYGVSDIVVVPSICLDSFPRVVVEAMAASKPVVGTCFGGASEIIEDGVTGYIVNPFNVEKMAKKITNLLRDSRKRERFGIAGRERVQKDFNLDDKVSKIILCYQKLLS